MSWADVAASAPLHAIEAGRILAGSAAPTACAEAALWAAATTQRASAYDRWGAQFVLLGTLLSARRDDDVLRLARLVERGDADLAGQFLMLANAAGWEPTSEADSVARALGTRYTAMSTARLWLLGTWIHARGERDALQVVAATLARRADSSHARVDRLVASAIGARAALARGDTTAAMRRLAALRPAASRTELTWYAWEALAAERVLLARLLLSRHDYAGAERVASQVDGLQAVASLIFLEPALQIRAQAAEAAGDAATARRVRQRLAWLVRSSAPLPAAPRVSLTTQP